MFCLTIGDNMNDILDEDIKILYAIAHQHEDASFDDEQKEAVRQIKRLAVSGNPDAANALDRLRHLPDMHPFLKEVLLA
jgi:hypothetical protein